MSIASEPQTPWAQERRKVSVPSWYHFTSCRRSSTRSVGSASTRYSSQCGSSIGLRVVAADAQLDVHRSQYTRAFGSNFVIVTGL